VKSFAKHGLARMSALGAKKQRDDERSPAHHPVGTRFRRLRNGPHPGAKQQLAKALHWGDTPCVSHPYASTDRDRSRCRVVRHRIRREAARALATDPLPSFVERRTVIRTEKAGARDVDRAPLMRTDPRECREARRARAHNRDWCATDRGRSHTADSRKRGKIGELERGRLNGAGRCQRVTAARRQCRHRQRGRAIRHEITPLYRTTHRLRARARACSPTTGAGDYRIIRFFGHHNYLRSDVIWFVRE